MSSPLFTAKTDPAEYERMQQEYRRAARREGWIVIGCFLALHLLVISVCYGLYHLFF